MVQKAKKSKKNSKKIGFIVGSIIFFIVGIIFLDIFIENIPNNIRVLNMELIDYPEYASEIMTEIRITRAIGIGLLVLGIASITMGFVFLIKISKK